MQMENPTQTLLAVLAHPDDESFGMGGTLALYSKRGVATYLVCATRGEVGDMDEDCLDGFESVTERREYELRCAAEILGLSGVYFLGYRDSGMSGSPHNQHPQSLFAAPVDEVCQRIVYYIRLLKPQVVVTFDPAGGYRHPDHIAIHNATVAAFHAAGDPALVTDDLPPYQPQKLYYQTISKRFLKFVVWLLPILGQDPTSFGRNRDIDLKMVAADEFPINAKIEYSSVYSQKAEAFNCHASQGGMAMQRGLMGWFMRLIGNKETFTRAYPPPTPGSVEQDLFVGIR
jgi:LmbE family N-acetylglucosaminyl deacetylase